MDELKPCPFCGAAAELYEIHAYRKHSPLKGKVRVRCSRELCFARSIRTVWDTEADATRAWNRRA